jgi:Leucine-rich repeat (LRR) protein
MRKRKVMQQFEIRDDDHGIGKVLILKGAWSDDISGYMKKNNILALRLANSFGFKGDDLSFIPSLNFLRSLELYCWDAKNVKLLSMLKQLEVIGLQFRSSHKIDFSEFHDLKVAKVTWTKGLDSLFLAKNIVELNIQNYPYTNLIPIENMTELRKLHITSRKLGSLEGVVSLVNLELLDLYNCQQLTTTSGIELCPKLAKVEIEACNKLSA